MNPKQEVLQHYWKQAEYVKSVVSTNLLKLHGQGSLKSLDKNQLQSLMSFIGASVDEAASGYLKELERVLDRQEDDAKKK